jgi:hypothetical protein
MVTVALGRFVFPHRSAAKLRPRTRQVSVMASLRATLEEQIKSAPVVVFSKTFCPCVPG